MTDGLGRAILVVEDNSALRRLMARVLGDCGFVVLQASSGPQGLEMFRDHSPSVALVIADMVMPGMSGLDLAAELERQQPGIQILYISGYVSSVAMESIRQRSPDRVLLKPFDPGELVSRVLQILHPAAHPYDLGTERQMTQEAPFAWDRLMEASDLIAADAVEVVGYRNTSSGFAVAAAHSAALRAAGLEYAFREKSGDAAPFGLFVAPADTSQAREVIGRVGLGADIAQPV